MSSAGALGLPSEHCEGTLVAERTTTRSCRQLAALPVQSQSIATDINHVLVGTQL